MLLSGIAFLALNALPFAVREQSVGPVEVITNSVNQEPNDTTDIQQTSFLVYHLVFFIHCHHTCLSLVVLSLIT